MEQQQLKKKIINWNNYVENVSFVYFCKNYLTLFFINKIEDAMIFWKGNVSIIIEVAKWTMNSS